eukprot:m.38400 g.38400  ORF g.38400 m.38400 type:complete len:75 (+) comp10214_c0_seq2:84-308(+)
MPSLSQQQHQEDTTPSQQGKMFVGEEVDTIINDEHDKILSLFSNTIKGSKNVTPRQLREVFCTKAKYIIVVFVF